MDDQLQRYQRTQVLFQPTVILQDPTVRAKAILQLDRRPQHGQPDAGTEHQQQAHHDDRHVVTADPIDEAPHAARRLVRQAAGRAGG